MEITDRKQENLIKALMKGDTCKISDMLKTMGIKHKNEYGNWLVADAVIENISKLFSKRQRVMDMCLENKTDFRNIITLKEYRGIYEILKDGGYPKNTDGCQCHQRFGISKIEYCKGCINRKSLKPDACMKCWKEALNE